MMVPKVGDMLSDQWSTSTTNRGILLVLQHPLQPFLSPAPKAPQRGKCRYTAARTVSVSTLFQRRLWQLIVTTESLVGYDSSSFASIDAKLVSGNRPSIASK